MTIVILRFSNQQTFVLYVNFCDNQNHLDLDAKSNYDIGWV